MTEIEPKAETDLVSQLVKSWQLAEEYESMDEEKLASDAKYAVLAELAELSKKDRKLFCDKVNSANQNGNQNS
jgi:hypothetical protein